MKAYLANPLALLGMRHGYNRPLDRSDFGNGEKIPGWAGNYIPGVGEVRRHANLGIIAGDTASAVDTYSWDSTQKHPLGSIAVTVDGRVFRYSQAGASDLVAGELHQMAAPIPNHLAITSAAQAIGDGGAGAPIVFTPGNTAGAANLYAEGFLCISEGPGAGQVHKVSGHAAITASTAFNLYLMPDDKINIALTTATKYGLHHNNWKNVIQCPTAVTGHVAGVGVSAIVAANYGWLQTRGPASVLINGTPAITSPVANGATTAGSVDVWTTAAAAVTITPVGYMMQVGVSTKKNLVYLTID